MSVNAIAQKFKPDVIPAKAGIQKKSEINRAFNFKNLPGMYLIYYWIPAFAGMT